MKQNDFYFVQYLLYNQCHQYQDFVMKALTRMVLDS